MAAQMGLAVIPATIAASASLSAEVDLGASVLVGIAVPSGWTTASMTFQASVDGVTWNEVYTSAGSELTFSPAASTYLAVDPTTLRGMRAIKVRSGTAGSPVNQSSSVVVNLVAAL